MKKISALFLTAVLLLTMMAPALAADTATATTMRLASTEGTVTLTNQNGRSLTVKEDMKLYSGYTIKTGAESYAYISLDGSKAVKLDASTTVEVRKNGKELEVLVSAGKLFFNVTVPLEADETLEIRTSTIVTGIRGTSGIIDCVDEGSSTLYLLDGSVTMQAVDPATDKRVTVPVLAGQAALAVRQETIPGAPAAPSVEVRTMESEDVPGFAAVEIAKDTVLQEKITQQSTLDVKQVVEKATETLAQEQQKAAEVQKQVAQDRAKTEDKQTESPVVPGTNPPKDNNTSDDGDRNDGGTGGGGGNSGGGTGGGGGNGDGGTGGPVPPVPDSKTTRLEGTVTQAALTVALASFERVILTATATGVIDSGTLTVARGKTLEVDSGGTLTIASGATLTVKGILKNAGNFINQGYLNTETIVENAGIWSNEAGTQWANSGAVINTGTMNHGANGRIVSSGLVTNTDAGQWSNYGDVQFGAFGMVNGGTLRMSSGLIQCTGNGYAVTGSGTIDFTGGLFRSEHNSEVVPDGHFTDQENSLPRVRGQQDSGYVLGCGLNQFIAQVGNTPTTIFIHHAMEVASDLVIASGQNITLERSDGETLTVKNGATLTIASGAELTGNAALINEGAFINAGTLTTEHTVENIGTCTNLGEMQLGENGMTNEGTLTMEGGLIQGTGSGYVVAGNGTIDFTGGLFRSEGNSEVVPDDSFTDQINSPPRIRGQQDSGYLLGRGLNRFIAQASEIPTTITLDQAITVRDVVNIGAGQDIILESSGSGSLTVPSGIQNAGTLTIKSIILNADGSELLLNSTITNSGSLTVKTDGTVSGVNCAIDNQAGGQVSILTGGKVTSLGCGIKNSGAADAVRISDGIVEVTQTNSSEKYAIEGPFTYEGGSVRARAEANICSVLPGLTDAFNETQFMRAQSPDTSDGVWYWITPNPAYQA